MRFSCVRFVHRVSCAQSVQRVSTQVWTVEWFAESTTLPHECVVEIGEWCSIMREKPESGAYLSLRMCETQNWYTPAHNSLYTNWPSNYRHGGFSKALARMRARNYHATHLNSMCECVEFCAAERRKVECAPEWCQCHTFLVDCVFVSAKVLHGEIFATFCFEMKRLAEIILEN